MDQTQPPVPAAKPIFSKTNFFVDVSNNDENKILIVKCKKDHPTVCFAKIKTNPGDTV